MDLGVGRLQTLASMTAVWGERTRRQPIRRKGVLAMFSKPFACLILMTGGLCGMGGGGLAQDASARLQMPLTKTIARTTPTGRVPSLAVLNATGAMREGGKLTLTGVSPNSIVFADRPVRAAGHVMTEQ